MKHTSLHELISTLKKNKKQAQAGNEWSNILPKSSHARKKPPPPQIPLNILYDIRTQEITERQLLRLNFKQIVKVIKGRITVHETAN